MTIQSLLILALIISVFIIEKDRIINIFKLLLIIIFKRKFLFIWNKLYDKQPVEITKDIVIISITDKDFKDYKDSAKIFIKSIQLFEIRNIHKCSDSLVYKLKTECYDDKYIALHFDRV